LARRGRRFTSRVYAPGAHRRATMIRSYADRLFLLVLRGVLLAGVIAIGAAVTRNVTTTLQWAAHGCLPHTCAWTNEREACAGPPSRANCAVPPVAPQRAGQA